jgi:hypothetical protein
MLDNAETNAETKLGALGALVSTGHVDRLAWVGIDPEYPSGTQRSWPRSWRSSTS